MAKLKNQNFQVAIVGGGINGAVSAAALAERQAELDSLTAQLKYLSEQVDMSVIYLALLPNDSFSAIKPIGFLSGLEKGFIALLNAAANLSSILGYFIPWIITILVIVAIFKLISRIRRNR